MGVRSLITTPIHLPRGLVAMITWGGAATKTQARALLASIRPHLLAAGYLFMQAYLAETSGFHASEEELARLTPREWECLRLTAQGHREEQVAGMLGLGATTVRYHLDNVVRKLGAVNRTHAVALAAQLGLLGRVG
jgi:DNA-binding CsgD family transcriptional regulator